MIRLLKILLSLAGDLVIGIGHLILVCLVLWVFLQVFLWIMFKSCT